jgi:undecaprenyl-diphosphatase
VDIVSALIFSIVEGVSEFLPISSTGHLIITAGVLKIIQTDFVKDFEVIIQLGAVLAIVVLYFKTLIKSKTIWKKVLTAFLPTAVIGFVLFKFIKSFLEFAKIIL